jgi:hypothetical protein
MYINCPIRQHRQLLNKTLITQRVYHVITTIYLQTKVDPDYKPLQCVAENNAQLSAVTLNALKYSVTHQQSFYFRSC